MSHARKVRPLGLARPSLGSPERIKFPPLPQRSEQRISGVHGNAMNIPPPKATSERIIPSRAKSETLGAADHSESIIRDKDRQIKEMMSREGHLKKQIMLLQKEIQEITAESALKDNAIMAIKQQQSKVEELLQQETHWKEKYYKEVDCHESTKNSLKNEQQKVEDLQITMETQKSHHAKLIEMHEKEYANMENAKNKEIEEKDTKLKRLKTQIADTLQGNSRERQQQIDELTKELRNAQEEADALRIKVKVMNRNDKNNTNNCQNCKKLSAKLRDLEKTIKENGQ